jgi:hypothetical protein
MEEAVGAYIRENNMCQNNALSTLKEKGNITLGQATKTQRGSRCITIPFL